MRNVYRLAFALFAAASVPMILGNPVIAADFNADLRGGAAAIDVAVTLGCSGQRSGVRTGIERVVHNLFSPAG